jgi:hypothetical protein
MSSCMPIATANFLTLMTAVLPTSGVNVYFGNPMSMYTAPIHLQVYEVEGTQEWAELGPSYRREEMFAIKCKLSSYAGDTDFLSRMQETYNTFETITIAVANDPTLTGIPNGVITAGGTQGAVRIAQVTNMVFVPKGGANGKSMGELNFDVECTQRITSLT